MILPLFLKSFRTSRQVFIRRASLSSPDKAESLNKHDIQLKNELLDIETSFLIISLYHSDGLNLYVKKSMSPFSRQDKNLY